MANKVLVAYATKNWSTAEIARTITQVLNKNGVEAEMLLVTDVVDVQSYQAVILGSPLYEGRWLKEAHRFLKHHGAALRIRPLWLFSSGPLDDSADNGSVPPVSGVQRALIRLNAREHITFGGCLRDDARGWVAQTLISSGRRGDFRNFTQISDWAGRIATTLLDNTPGPSEAYATGRSTPPLRPPTVRRRLHHLLHRRPSAVVKERS
ncbi:flavodoxin domain-containing protein [Streptomyces sp. NPDC050095]|uniref:flavodoxin domain-containing protein n=1 Tax=unclassified Streptomyces TaxID=2593676 RepID=UPI003440653C